MTIVYLSLSTLLVIAVVSIASLCALRVASLALDLTDKGGSIWFKIASMDQGLKDRVQDREIGRDKADLALEAGRAGVEEGRRLCAGK